MQLDGVPLILIDTRLRVVIGVAVSESIRKNVVIDDIRRVIGHRKFGIKDGLPKSTNAGRYVRCFNDFTDAVTAPFAVPKHAVAVVAVDKYLASNHDFKIIPIHAHIGKGMVCAPALPDALHRHPRQWLVLQQLLIAFESALFDNQCRPLNAR